MKKWFDEFEYNPISTLLDCGDKSISLFTERDLLDKNVSTQDLWQLSGPQSIIKKQKPNGSWVYPEQRIIFAHRRTTTKSKLIEAWEFWLRNLDLIKNILRFRMLQNISLLSKRMREISEVFTAVNIVLTILRG